jgi:hypothetical protein
MSGRAPVRLLAVALIAWLAWAQTVKQNDVTVATRACQGQFRSLPFCDPSLPRAARVQDLIERLWANASWIAPQLTARHTGGGGNPKAPDAVPALGLPEFDWGTNCAHGVQSSCVEPLDGSGARCPTSFPNPINYGAAWNDTLALRMGAIIATEARALWLAGAVEASPWSGRPHIAPECWSPNINIARDPRWGRIVEVASEDPLLNGAFGEAYSRGLQEGEDSRFIKTGEHHPCTAPHVRACVTRVCVCVRVRSCHA